MKQIRILLFMILCFAISTVAMAEKDVLMEWSKISTTLFEEAKKSNYVATKDHWQRLQENFTSNCSLYYKEKANDETIAVLNTTLVDLDKSLNRMVPDHKQIVQDATKLHLAFNATCYKYQPLWRQYYIELRQSIDKLQLAMKHKDHNQFGVELTKFAEIFSLVRPALFIAKNGATVRELDSILNFLQNEDKKFAGKQDGLLNLKILLQQIFSGPAQDVSTDINSSVRNLLGWTLGLITGVLGYIGWRYIHRARASR